MTRRASAVPGEEELTNLLGNNNGGWRVWKGAGPGSRGFLICSGVGSADGDPMEPMSNSHTPFLSTIESGSPFPVSRDKFGPRSWPVTAAGANNGCRVQSCLTPSRPAVLT